MLSIYFGDMPEAIYNTAVYFKNAYRDAWITNEESVRMIKDVDRSDVISTNAIQSPVLGTITPLQLSGGVKTLMLIKFDHSHVFNASTCGDNCAEWILRMAAKRKSSSTSTMSWISVKTTSKSGSSTVDIVHNMTELIHESIPYL